MKIQIFGTGCANCQMLEKNAREAVKELGIDADFEKIKDMDKILEEGLTALPGLAVDGELKIMGRVASKDEIKKILS
ncbi:MULTISPECIES: MTH895/ArsE family thioredoxin-like protein [Methanothermobacter]|uniref:Thioredoxin n=1 Tax=Methanothermobacter wolfeii TaxID=145261 RepID=A0A9E7UMP7_METWO|nr:MULTISPECIES: MTH895/ArsE family thioredoxin-like protein [Methanothermobacter]MDI6702314.1 MTH895/ArsE family thioredoxin-like protein [Methanothermobacter wolfeii]MDI6842292.1 MTH895/ArsE family thioredoxin-like protein [Methanothermobacter wolfeii]NLM02543.1 thioredoxin family protein [Methanothermobacter wolfeii]QHN06637.1 thioredoxin family protein [Methanothermobacter sp. THM-1]UXH31192.1 MTH895/ArsE family thioredoxin-like protein [Methanothermobacter wolfeii]